MITGRGSSADELPEFSPAYVASSTLGLVVLTIFTNVMFDLYVKPSVDGVDPPERIQRERAPLVNPADRPPRVVSAQCTAYSFVKRYVPRVKRDILLCGQDYFSVVPSYSSKLEGRKRTAGDVSVLAVPRPNTHICVRPRTKVK